MSRLKPLLALDLLRLEGWRAVRDRLLDRWADRRWARSFPPPCVLDPANLDAPWSSRDRTGGIPLLRIFAHRPARRFGGVDHHLIHHLEADPTWALIHRVDEGYRVWIRDEGGHQTWSWQPAPPPSPVVLHDPIFERVVLATAHMLQAKALRIESPQGLPLGSLAHLAGQSLPTELAVHDFSLFCHRPHLLEHPQLQFCDYCQDLDRCVACLGPSLKIRASDQAERRKAAADLLVKSDRVEYPSDFLLRRHRELFPSAWSEGGSQHVVRSPFRLEAADPLGRGSTSRRPAVAVVGGLKPHKGSRMLFELLRRLSREERREWRFVSFGAGESQEMRQAKALGVDIRGYYRAGTLPSLLRSSGATVALLLSVVPESYSLTLDECREAGVPVIAFDLGAVADRIRKSGSGHLVPLASGAGGLAHSLRSLMANPA